MIESRLIRTDMFESFSIIYVGWSNGYFAHKSLMHINSHMPLIPKPNIFFTFCSITGIRVRTIGPVALSVFPEN